MDQKKVVNEENLEIKDKQDPSLFIALVDDKKYSSSNIPCSFDQKAFLPYWDKIDEEMIYGIDEGVVKSIYGCGDVWICGVKLKNGTIVTALEPNIDVFFTQKEAERKLTGIKRTEDIKKISKWRRQKQDV